MKSFVFRVDASVSIGSGHVMRCICLAKELSNRGHRCIFLTKKLSGNLIDLIVSMGFEVKVIYPRMSNRDGIMGGYENWLESSKEEDANDSLSSLGDEKFDWLIVDHYALDKEWEHKVKIRFDFVMVIDDLSNRVHDCDLLLDQTLGKNIMDYKSLVPEGSVVLVGAKYALLRSEFKRYREALGHERNLDSVKNVLITLGGSDQENFTKLVINAIRPLLIENKINATVVMGSSAPWYDDIVKETTTDDFFDIKKNVNDMALLMGQNELCIGAAGSTSWERCCLGLPTLMLVLADNQRKIAENLEQVGAVLVAKPDEFSISESFSTLLHDCELRKKLSLQASVVCDGLGVDRVVAAIEEIA